MRQLHFESLEFTYLGGINDSSAVIVRMNEWMYCDVSITLFICFMWIVDILWSISLHFSYLLSFKYHTHNVCYEIAWCVHSFLVIHLNYLNTHSHTHKGTKRHRLYGLLTFLNDLNTNTQRITSPHIIIYGFTYGAVCYWRHSTLCPHCHHCCLLIYWWIQVILIRNDIIKWLWLCICVCLQMYWSSSESHDVQIVGWFIYFFS